jgi:hypothetical protein
VNWTEIENAIQAEIASSLARSTGIPSERVRWEIQSRSTPEGAQTYATIRIDNLSSTSSLPEQRITDNPQATPGKEILIESVEQIEFDVSLTVYSVQSTGSRSAIALASECRAWLMSEFASSLESAGVVVFRTESVQRVPALLETEFEDRAQFVARMRVCGGVSVPSTWIESAEWSAVFS